MQKRTNSNKQKVTLSIDKNTYKEYQDYCDEHAILLSKSIELFMKNKLEEAKQHRSQKIAKTSDAV